jgi:hypothetical protein
METLVLNAPSWRENEDGAKSFESMEASGRGDGYAIASTLVTRIAPGCPVVVLNKERSLRAEGTLLRLVPTSKTASGIQRYDVYMSGLRRVPYRPEALNRCGVAVK